MANFLQGLQLTCSAAGNITPMSFICIDGVQPDIAQARLATAAGDIAIGISNPGADNGPGLGYIFGGSSTLYAAQPTEPVPSYDLGDICPLVLGAGGASAGALLTWDASGHGVMTAPGGNVRYGAIAWQAGSAGDIIGVLFVIDKS